jgi:hypothetical protein
VVWWSYKWKNKNKSEELLFDEYGRMKENWMEKLIELLNEYDDNNWGVTDYWALFNRMNEWISDAEYLQVISKKFWFIWWLVDNDKIDRDKIIEKSDFMPIVSNKVWDFFQPTEEQELLMLLSIQDNPIEFLCSVLK